MHRTGNLYQIFTYVKNKQIEVLGNDVEVGGMLLYAEASSKILYDTDYVVGGNMISPYTCLIWNLV